MQFLSFPTALSSNSLSYPPFLRFGARLSNQIIGLTPISPFTAQLFRTLSLIDQSSYPSPCYNAVRETVNTGDATEMEFVETGYICSVHGLQGEVRVKPATDFPEMRFSEPGRRWLRQQILGRQIIQEFELVEGRGHHGQKSWIIKFDEINTVEQAQKLVGSTILVAENDRPTLQEGEIYTRDLVGMRVLLKETRELVGTVINVFNTGANDLLQVELDSSFSSTWSIHEAKEAAGAFGTLVWVPFVEAIVPDVDLRKKEMLITPPIGLLELNIRSDDRPKKERPACEEWKERKKFQRQLIQAKKKLQELEQHHVFQGFRHGEKSQKSRLANEIVSVNSELIGYALNNMVVPSRRWSFSDFVRTSTKHTLKVSEEICYNGKGENSERGQHLISCGKAAFVLYATQMDLENPMEETYQHLKQALLHDDAGDQSSVPLILICPTHSLDSLKELFMNHDFFSFDSEKVWFLAEEMLPVVSSSREENKHNILMKSPWEILQRPVGSGGIVATLSIHNLLENLREMNVDYIQMQNQQKLLGFTDSCKANIGIQFKDMDSNEDDLKMVLSIGFMEKLTKQMDKLQFHAVLKPNQHSKLVDQEWVNVTPSSPNSYEFHCSLLSCVNACSPTKVCLLEVAA